MFQASVRERSILSTLPLLIVKNFTIPDPPFSVVVWVIMFLLLLPPPLSILQHRFTALPHPLPTSSTGMDHRPPGHCPHPPPASLRRLYMCPTPCACFLLRFPCPFPLHFRPHSVPRSLSVPGGSSDVVPSVSIVFLPISLPVLIDVARNLLVFGFILLGWPFSLAKIMGLGASTTWQLLAPVLALLH